MARGKENEGTGKRKRVKTTSNATATDDGDKKKFKKRKRSNRRAEPEVQIDETMLSQSIAMSIPLILENVLDHLDFNSLKEARLVCTDWNSAASTVLSKRGELQTRKIAYSMEHGEITQQLVRNVTARIGPSFDQRQLIEFCKLYTTKIRGLRIYAKRGQEAVIHNILQNICPNVEYIKIFMEEYPRIEPQESPKITKLLSLKSINVDNCETGFIENLIEMSDQLRYLKVDGRLTLKLGKSIKDLTLWYKSNGGRTGFAPADLQNFSEVIESRVGVLESLTLQLRKGGRIRYSYPHYPNSFLTLPLMNKLSKLTIDTIHGIPFNSLSFVESLPSLTTLNFNGTHSTYHKWNFDVLTNGVLSDNNNEFIGNQHLALKTLNVTGTQFKQFRTIVTLTKMFPNLTSLCCTLGNGLGSRDYSSSTFLNTFRACNSIKLKQLNLTLAFSYRLSYFLESLESNSAFVKELQTLKIENQCGDTDDLSSGLFMKLKNVLRLTKALNRCDFKNFMLRLQNAVALDKFIAEENLPVKFLYEEDY